MTKEKTRLVGLYALLVASQKQRELVCYEGLERKKRKGSFFTPDNYKLYLVNESKFILDKVEIELGGFEGSDDVLIELNPANKTYTDFRPGKFVKIDKLDMGMLDFMLWHKLKIQFSDGIIVGAQFTIGKAYALKKDILKYSATLDRKGYCFPLEEEPARE
ncbi:MAG: hypothetical protein ABIB97_04505 [Patescibacteria group bacterium]